MFYFDPLYIALMLPVIVLIIWAQHRVKSTFNRYARVPNRRGVTGAEAARLILDANGLYHVPVERTPGQLTDHYDPRRRALRLSDSVYASRSVAALGVAAHEAGHALQHALGYVPLQVRGALVPLASVGSNLGWIMVLIGIVVGLTQVAWLGVALFAAATIFALVTLPVEFNASSRAMAQLTSLGLISRLEYDQSREVLNAAAWTYIAAFAAAAVQLIYYIMLVLSASRR